MSSCTWCGVCRQIMVGLLLVINWLHSFFLFFLLITKVHNCPLCLLFIKSGMFVIFTCFGSGMTAKLKELEPSNHARSIRLGLATMLDPYTWVCQIRTWVKKVKFFQKYDWIAKTNTILFKQDFSFICSRT